MVAWGNRALALVPMIQVGDCRLRRVGTLVKSVLSVEGGSLAVVLSERHVHASVSSY